MYLSLVVFDRVLKIYSNCYSKGAKIECKRSCRHPENERNLNGSLSVSAIKSNSKFVNTKIVPLILKNDIITDPKSIAQVLREQYDSVYSKPDEYC